MVVIISDQRRSRGYEEVPWANTGDASLISPAIYRGGSGDENILEPFQRFQPYGVKAIQNR